MMANRLESWINTFRNWRKKRVLHVAVKRIAIHGVTLDIMDFAESVVSTSVPDELRDDCYNLERIPFRPGDHVVDVGANVGITSIYLAKRFPEVRIYAYEPIPENYRHLCENLRLNSVSNVKPHNLAVTADGRALRMSAHFYSNSGSASANFQNVRRPGHFHYEVESTTLDTIFRRHAIERCRLLKIDCEGSEHEILLGTTVLARIEWLSAEFHMNRRLAEQGYSFERLEAHCLRFIDPDHFKASRLQMPD